MNGPTKDGQPSPHPHRKGSDNSHGPVGVDIRVLDVLPHAREQHLELLRRPAEAALLLGAGEDGEGEGAEAGEDVFGAPDAC